MSDEGRKPTMDEFAAEAIESAGGVIGNYVVIAEVVYEEGATLSFAMSEHLPPWTAKGMLMSTLEMLNFSSYGPGAEEAYDDADEEDEDF